MNDVAEMSDDDFQKMMFDDVQTLNELEKDKDKNKINYDNVIQDDYEPYKMETGEHLANVFSILQEKMENFYDYVFIVHSSLTSEVPNTVDTDWFGKKRVLIWTAGEHKYHPEDMVKNNYHHIFANYHWDTDHITSIPLGCYAKSKESTEKKIFPMEERLNNLNFVGCLNRNRLQLCSILSKVPYLALILFSYAKEYRILEFINHMVKWLHPRDYFKFTPDFAKGFDPDTYLNLLHSSKISLCPRGWSNVESFRIYESMRAGCVTITEKLPDRSYYKDIPVIQVDNWQDGLNIARDLLKDNSGLLTRIGDASRQFYETKLSPEATAKIIMDKLAEKAI